MPADRLLGADFVRASACLIVLFHHLSQRMSFRADFGWLEGFRVFTQIGTFGVAMFFVLSGFLLARPFWAALDRGAPMPSLGAYALRRAARILPGFWLALSVSFILSVTVFGFAPDGQLWLRYLAGVLALADWHWVTFFPVEIDGPLWSISFEVTSYVLLALALAAVFGLTRGSGIARLLASRLLWLGVIAIALVLHWLYVRLYPIDAQGRGWQFGLIGGAKYWMPRFNPFAFFAMFAIGSLAAGVQVWLARRRHWAFDLVALAGIALVVWGFYLQSRAGGTEGYSVLGVPYGYPWFELAIGLVLVATPSSVLVGRFLDNPVTRYVAQISFGIYVWHYSVLELVRFYWAPGFGLGGERDPVRFIAVSLVIGGITVLIAHLSYRLMEKPVIEWARRRERGRADEPTLSPAAG